MYETPDETERLRDLLDRSAAGAGAHLRSIADGDRRLSAEQVCERLTGMRLLVLATATADGRPLTGPIDGYFLHGSWYFSSARNSVRMRHLATRPAVSATHLPDEKLAIVVHGRGALFDLQGPDGADLRQAMLDHYLPRQGPSFAEWLNQLDGVGGRIEAEKMFTFAAGGLTRPGAPRPTRLVPRAPAASRTSGAERIRCFANEFVANPTDMS